MVEEKEDKLWRNVGITIALLLLLWVVHYVRRSGIYGFEDFVNTPRTLKGLLGIFFSPFIHGSDEHILSNSLPLIVLLFVLLSNYPKLALRVYLFVHIISGVLVWAFGAQGSHHVGISGVIYGLAFFLLSSGIFRGDRTSITLAILVVLVYGSMLIGFVPQPGVSWHSHFFGALSGVIVAFLLRREALPPPHPYQLEKTEPEVHFFDDENAHK